MSAMDNTGPFHTVIDTLTLREEVVLTVMCHRERFIITVSLEKLRQESIAEHKYSNVSSAERFRDFVERIDDPYIMEDFEDWALEPCIPFLQQAASKPLKRSFTLQEYFDPLTTFLEVVNSHDGIAARESDKTHHVQLLSSKLSTLDLPMFPGYPRDLQCFNADQVEIAYVPGFNQEKFCQMPGIVALQGEPGQQFFFKAAIESDSFQRELKILLQVKNLKIEGVSKICGLVKFANSQSIMGMLLEIIPHQRNLRQAMENHVSNAQKKKWMQQIYTTVRALHGAEIVWGDVKPDNILVDNNDNAIIIDFGGGNSPEFIDEQLHETYEGDWQGVSTLAVQLA